ncbi:hypothetical protein HYH03_001680 [Edaphochlamys debaryana]|uniref:Guanylate cyclase domain-containing protein n=1 Tax=Edaphochlamys debaryana TaxID=47281 RepID=A0A836C5V4_9CHLO|nr:hypothetical protein HYH03_001680 [Edaphochlamys debaryana]|eukprot:KAG2500097.1 hypothetical protein HYH03_001680 [Edaphochlamys debaryana]
MPAAAAPPDDWEGLLALLEGHRMAVAKAAAEPGSGGAGGLPAHGLCVTMHPDCGRVGDVWAAVAASVLQTEGTEQGYVYDLSHPPPAALPLMNTSGWAYAADVVRRLLSYNAPDVDNSTGSPYYTCGAFSSLFGNGSCLFTIEWDAVFESIARSPAFMPGGLSVRAAPLPGSRVVLDRNISSSTYGSLVNCTAKLCAASLNHDLLYGDLRGWVDTAAGVTLAVQADYWSVVAGNSTDPGSPSECPVAQVLRLEADGVAAAANLGAVPPDVRQPVNRVPYSAFMATQIMFESGPSRHFPSDAFAALSDVVEEHVLRPLATRSAASLAARLALGYAAPSNSSAGSDVQGGGAGGGGGGGSQKYVSTRWWKALEQPFSVDALSALGIEPAASQSYMRAVWHAVHSPNGASDPSSPITVNFVKWGLSHVAATLEPGGSAAGNVSHATAQLGHVISLLLEAVGEDKTRARYEASLGTSWNASGAGRNRGAAVPITIEIEYEQNGLSPGGLAAILAPVLGATVLGGVLMMAAVLRMRRRNRDLLGRVMAPRAGPDTSLLVSDIQNSTRLWEELSTATMDAALRTHHATIRRVMAAHDGYESATEGDSFIVAFPTPSHALAFASACQLALVGAEWPPELLAHADGCPVFAEAREGEAPALSSPRFSTAGSLRAAGGGGGGGGGGAGAGVSGGLWAWLRDGLLLRKWRRGGVEVPGSKGRQVPGMMSEGQDRNSAYGAAYLAALYGSNAPASVGDSTCPDLALDLASGPTAAPPALESSTFNALRDLAHPSSGGYGGTVAADRTSAASADRPSGAGWPAGLGALHTTHGAAGEGVSSTWGRMLAAVFPLITAGIGLDGDLLGTAGSLGGSPRAPSGLPHLLLRGSGKATQQSKERRVTVFCGPRVRMGIHSGLDDGPYMSFNKTNSTHQYSGAFAETAKLVGDAAPGGLITLSGAAFARLRRADADTTGAPTGAAATKPAATVTGRGAGGGGGGGRTGAVVCYAGHFVLSASAAKPKAASIPSVSGDGNGSDVGDVRLEIPDGDLHDSGLPGPAAMTDAGQAGPAPGPSRSRSSRSADGAAAEDPEEDAGVPLFLAAPASLVCRLPYAPPLRGVRQTQLGTMAAPTGMVTIAFMKVVGASTLLADLPDCAARALAQLQALAARLLGRGGGYAVEAGEGLVLAAFGSPLAAVEWALDTVEGLRALAWEEELLAHELCEEVLIAGAGATSASAPAPHAAPAPSTPVPSRTRRTQRSPPGTAFSTAASATSSPMHPTQSPAGPGRTPLGPGQAPPGPCQDQQGPEQRRVVEPLRRIVERGLRVKVGIDVGPVTYSLTPASGRLSYRGKVMNRAARVAGAAASGQVLCTGAVWTACEAGMASVSGGEGGGGGASVFGLSLGRAPLKGITAPVELVQCARMQGGGWLA